MSHNVLRCFQIVSAAVLCIGLVVLGGSIFAAQNKNYTLRVPNGLTTLPTSRVTKTGRSRAVSQTEALLKVMVANPTMIDAYRAGVPGNGKPFRRFQNCQD